MEEEKRYFSNPDLAKIYTHIAYRNTDELEDSHSASVTMSESFYSVMYRVVDEHMQDIKLYHSELTKIREISDIQRIAEQSRRGKISPFVRFLAGALFNHQFGTDWDAPKQIDAKPQTDVTAYVLGGHFKKCCDEHRKLDDDVMCFVNKDICNRFYSLICAGAFLKHD